MSEWIDVRKRLPEAAGIYLIYAQTRFKHGVDPYYMSAGNSRYRVGYFNQKFRWNAVTHWQPLPEPPND